MHCHDEVACANFMHTACNSMCFYCYLYFRVYVQWLFQYIYTMVSKVITMWKCEFMNWTPHQTLESRCPLVISRPDVFVPDIKIYRGRPLRLDTATESPHSNNTLNFTGILYNNSCFQGNGNKCMPAVLSPAGWSAACVAGRPGEELSHLLCGRPEAAAAAGNQCNRY